MRLTRRHKVIIALASLFVLTNILLIYIDKEQKVEKTSHIKKWTKMMEKDMYESVDTEGVLDFSDESHVYFDDRLGKFQSFLVEEGQHISVGEALYTYEISNYYETASQLEGEIEKLRDEIKAIETAISKMKSYQIPKSSAPPPQKNSVPPVEKEVNDDSDLRGESVVSRFEEDMNHAQDSGQAELIKEQYITEKEKELAQKEAERNSVESQLSELMSMGDTITVESPYEGIVTSISEALEDPLLTVQSDELIVKSELTEQEHLEVEPEQSVYITMMQSDKAEEGVIEEVSHIPDEINLKGESRYPFTVTLVEEEVQNQEQGLGQNQEQEQGQGQNPEQSEEQGQGQGSEQNQEQGQSQDQMLEEERETLFPGYHANLEIVTKESPGATVVNKDDLDGNAIWVMTPSGTIVKNPVETGIQMGSIIEITAGAGMDDWIAVEPKDRLTSHSPFITSLDVKKVNAKRLKSDRWIRDLMIGLISR